MYVNNGHARDSVCTDVKWVVSIHKIYDGYGLKSEATDKYKFFILMINEMFQWYLVGITS